MWATFGTRHLLPQLCVTSIFCQFAIPFWIDELTNLQPYSLWAYNLWPYNLQANNLWPYSMHLQPYNIWAYDLWPYSPMRPTAYSIPCTSHTSNDLQYQVPYICLDTTSLLATHSSFSVARSDITTSNSQLIFQLPDPMSPPATHHSLFSCQIQCHCQQLAPFLSCQTIRYMVLTKVAGQYNSPDPPARIL